MPKMCILEDKVCINCGDCERCDLDKNKICDNCEKCLKMPEGEYYEIVIDEIMGEKEE